MASDDESEPDAAYRPPSAAGPSNDLYLQLALTAGGNVLALLVVAVAYYCWLVLADYRGALLWSVLSSIALRDLRDFLVSDATRRLGTTRSLPRILWQLACLPFATLFDTLQDLKWLWAKWRQSVSDYLKVYRRQARKRLVHFSPSKRAAVAQPAAGATSAAANATLDRATPTADIAPLTPLSQLQTGGGNVSGELANSGAAGTVYGTALVVAKCVSLGIKTLQSSSFKRQRTRRRRPADDDPVASNVLFQWLFRCCIAYQTYLWLRSSFAAAMHVLLLVVTLVATFVAVPALVAVGARWVLSAGPDSSSSSSSRKEETVSTPRKDQPRKPAKRSGLQAAVDWPLARAKAADEWVCGVLKAHIRPLVSAGLIFSTLAGAVLLIAFFTVQIGQESRESLAALREAIPRGWAAPTEPGAGASASSSTAASSVGDGAFVAAAPLRRALLQYRPQLVEAAGQAVPWLESQLTAVLQSYNLSQVVEELRSLQGELQEHHGCSAADSRAALIALARAHCAARRQSEQHASRQAQVAALDSQLSAAAEELRRRLEAPTLASPYTAQAPGPDNDGNATALAASEEAIVEMDARLAEERSALAAAAAARDAAARELRQAEKRQRACSGEAQRSKHAGTAAAGPGPGRKLQEAYESFAQLRLREGVGSLQALGAQFLSAARKSLSGSGGGGASQELQQLAQAAAEPLLSLGKVVGSSVLNSSSLALTGGIGVMRLCLGMINFGVQAMLFTFLLYALLAAETDPLSYTIKVLPLSDDARERTAAAFTDALKSVFVSSIKLAAFHALFTWLTFRMFGIHLIYLSVMASALAASLPLLPVCLVAVPAALQLFAQGRGVAAVALSTLHVLAYYVADSIIMAEVPGSQRFPTITALGVLGGISAFGNPIQGALLGPMLLSSIVVFFDLHVRLIAGLPSNNASAASLHSLGRSRSMSLESM